MISIQTNINWLDEQSKTNGNNIFLEDDYTSLTFSDVKDKVRFFADCFSASGINEGLKVALLLNNSIDFIISILALWQLGATPVPINLLWDVQQINDIIDNYKFEKIIVDKKPEGVKKRPFCDFISLNNLTGTSVATCENKFDLHNEALMLFTSGSIDKPKGVLFSFNNLLQSALNVDSFVNHSVHDKWLASLPFYHIGGFSIITRSLLSGCSTFIPSSLKHDDIKISLNEKNISLASLVVTQLKKVIDSGISLPKSLRHLLLGGGPISDELIKKAIALNYPIVKVYGSTETASMVTALDVAKESARSDSVGRPLGDVILRLGDKENQEIRIKSDCVAEYYLEENRRINIKDEDGFYNSGDIGQLENSYLYITDRGKRIIISGGENISASEIENTLLQFPDIKDAYVKPVPDTKWGEVPLAVIALKIHSRAGLSEITEFIDSRLPSFKRPKHYLILDDIPRNELGKINNYELEEIIKRS